MSDERTHRRGRAIRRAVLVVALGVLALPAGAGAFVYWANESGNTIGRANLDGSAPNQYFITGASSPVGVAVDGSHIYWANESANSIGRANLDGSAPNQYFISGADHPKWVAVDGSHIYWANTTADTIGRANLDGSSPEQSFITGAGLPSGVAVDGDHVYWASQSPADTIGRANLDGSSPEQSFIAASNPQGVAVDDSHIYWANQGAATIGRANLDGSSPNQSLISGGNIVCGVAVDGTHVYWANALGEATIGRANLDGSSPNQSLISGASHPCGVAVDPFPLATTLQVTCAPVVVKLLGRAECTAGVADTLAGQIAPSGTVTFSSNGGAGDFSSSAACILTSTGVDQAACQLTYTPSTATNQAISGTYSGDFKHAQSNGATVLQVLASKPSNAFTLAKPKLDKKTGTATLTAMVPGPGKLVLTGTGVQRRTQRVNAAGKFKVVVKPAKSAATELKRTGSAKLIAKVTYTPTGGDPNTKSRKLGLKRS